jgi:class 3 adenylate cyclase
VAIGAGVGALATAREVLVTSTLKDLVVGSELCFDDRGVHELKGVPNAWHLYALKDAASDSEVPPGTSTARSAPVKVGR